MCRNRPTRGRERKQLIYAVSLYLFGEIAFLLAGLAILAKNTRISRLSIAGCIWLLAMFCVLHGLYDGLKLYNTISNQMNLLDSAHPIWALRYVFLGLAFMFLAFFAINLIDRAQLRGTEILSRHIRLLELLIFVAVALLIFSSLGSISEIHLRRYVALPAGVIAGVVLWIYSSQLEQRAQEGSVYMRNAAIVLILIGLAAPIVPPHSSAQLETYALLTFRALSALFLMYFVLRALSIFDVEQLDLLEERLSRFAQTEKLTSLGRLAAGVAHEINNPLANASLHADLLRDHLAKDLNALKRLDTIDQNIDRAASIAKELLHVSREADRDRMSHENLVQIVERAIKLVDLQADSIAIDLVVNANPQVRAIAWKLEEVMINLLLNAMDASASGQSITVSIDAGAKEAMVTISDQGTGISEEIRDRIFDPFFTTKEPGKGTGLGLSVCFGIVHNHGGRIEVNRNAPGGSDFVVTIPLVNE